jgi:hypothetical protein
MVKISPDLYIIVSDISPKGKCQEMGGGGGEWDRGYIWFTNLIFGRSNIYQAFTNLDDFNGVYFPKKTHVMFLTTV